MARQTFHDEPPARLAPRCCYNYRTQLALAGRLALDSLGRGESVALVLDKNAEEALATLATLGFALRPALLDHRLDIHCHRRGVRERVFFRGDYETLLAEAVTSPRGPVDHLIMIEFGALFEHAVEVAIDNQLADFDDVLRTRRTRVSGLYSPLRWTTDDPLSRCLRRRLGADSVRRVTLAGVHAEAVEHGDDGVSPADGPAIGTGSGRAFGGASDSACGRIEDAA